MFKRIVSVTLVSTMLISMCSGFTPYNKNASNGAAGGKNTALASYEETSFYDLLKAAFKPTGGNYGNEMKITGLEDTSPNDGADAVERLGDHVDSPYFSVLDFYNMKSTESLTILERFKTYQQTNEYSCGIAAALMVLNRYEALGEYNEGMLTELRRDHSNEHIGTCLLQMQDIFDKIGNFEYASTYDYIDNMEEITMELFRSYLDKGIPVMVAWNDWGGHWQVIIGYDDMGTEYEGDDVIIVADPYDTTDHNQDGYGVYSAMRFYYNFTLYDNFENGDLNDMVFIAAWPKQ